MKTKLSVKEVVQLIETNDNIVFIQDIIDLLKINWTTFYKWYPKDSDDYQAINDALEMNKTTFKQKIRLKMLESGNATSLIFLYKALTTDPAERRALDGRDNQVDNTDKKIVLEIK